MARSKGPDGHLFAYKYIAATMWCLGRSAEGLTRRELGDAHGFTKTQSGILIRMLVALKIIEFRHFKRESPNGIESEVYYPVRTLATIEDLE